MRDREELRGRLRALGFDVVRFVRLDAPPPEMQAGLGQWLAEGRQADMDWMARTADKRADPRLVLAGARSAVLLGVNYWPGELPPGEAQWARYALHQDYHDTMKGALAEAGRVLEAWGGIDSQGYRYYVDTGPVLERGWAERGGVGFLGKNAMLISREFGNWLFLAEILTVLELEPDPPLATAGEKGRIGLHCGRCTRCLDACPTAAIRAPGVVDARRCISYQTIENKGIIPRELRAAIGRHVYGCDVCLEVCPWNRFARESRSVLLVARHDLAGLTLPELLALTPERFAEVFRKTPMKRAKLAGILRNACIVATNTGARPCLDRIVALAEHASPVVRAHAVWAVFRLAGAEEAWARLENARAAESDPQVLAEYEAERVGQAPGP